MNEHVRKTIKKKKDCQETLKENLIKFRKEYCSLIDLFSPKANALIDQLEYEKRKNFYFRKLNKLEKVDPDVEVWLPMVYYRYSPSNLNTNKKEDRFFKDLWISNKGRIFNLKRYKLEKCSIGERGYVHYGLSGYIMPVHRIVASTWIPRPNNLNLMEFKELEVNHINGKKDDPSKNNLEWCTPAQNRSHAKENNLLVSHKHLSHPLVIPMKGTVIDIPGFKKRVIYVCGKEQCEKIGLNYKVLHKIRTGKTKTYRGCKWEEVSKEEYVKHYQEPDLDLINALANYNYDRTSRKSTRKDKVAWELTHVVTKNKRIVSGTIELAKLGMNSGNINRQYRLGRNYKNYKVARLN